MLQGAARREPPRDGTARTSGGGGGGDGGGCGRDRISGLPDELRHHIFSFMPAWEVVRTSTLSRQWRHIWASAPSLDIHYPCRCDDVNEQDDDDQDWYAEFVKHLLLRRRKSAPLDTLRLHWNHDDANTWIAHAVRRNARAIDLSGEHHPKLEPEYLIFLYGNLKILQLSHLHMSINTLSQLCSRCSSLEELELKNVDIHAMYIRSTSLKRLTMVSCVNPNGLSVDAPNLVLLRCIRPHNFVPGIENSGSLLTASIMLDDNCLQYYRPYTIKEKIPPCPRCADAKDPGHSESQSEPDDDSSAGSDAEDPGHNESQSEPDDDSSTSSDAEDPGHSESQSEPDDDSSAGSDAEDPDNNDHDGEITDVYSREDDDKSAGSDAEEADNSDGDDGDDEIAYVYSSEDDWYDRPIFGGHGILRSFSNVITMNLSAHYGELVLRKELEKNCPEFKNLRTLSLGEWCTDLDFYSLSTMLEKSPNLENLFIRLEACSSRDIIYPRERSFTCNNLKVKISYSMRDGTRARRLEIFLLTNYGSREKRKAQGEAGKSPAKLRKVRKSRSPEGGQGGRN